MNIRRTLVATVTLWWIACCAAQAADQDGIHVSGRGELVVEPDRARVTLQVTRQGRDAVALKEQLDAVTAQVLELTDELGIDRKHVTAALVNIRPHRRHDGRTQIIDGVIASRTISVELHVLDRLGRLMNEALALGVNDIGGVQLDVSNRPELEQQALRLAIDDARATAQRVADSLGVPLAGVVAVHVGRHHVHPQTARVAFEVADAAASFSPGQIVVERTVQATFAIGGQ